MALDIDYLTGGLVQLSCSSETGHYLADAMLSGPLFYRVLGRESTLLYTISLLTEPKKTRRVGEVYYYPEITENLDFLIDGLDKESKHETPNYGPKQQAVLTIENYVRQNNETINYLELREEFQSYKTILENLKKGMILTEREEEIKERFLSLLRFFVELEHRHYERKLLSEDTDDWFSPDVFSGMDANCGEL